MTTKNPIKNVNFQAANIKSRSITGAKGSTKAMPVADWSATGKAIAGIGSDIAAGIMKKAARDAEDGKKLDCKGKDIDDPVCVKLNNPTNKEEEEDGGNTKYEDDTIKVVNDKPTEVLDKIENQNNGVSAFDIKTHTESNTPFSNPTFMKIKPNPVMQKMGVKKGGFKLRSI